MAVNPDFKDLFSIFNAHDVEYLVVGAHAVIYYGRPRFTKDLDVWVNPDPRNAGRVWRALQQFGAPLRDLSEHDFSDPALMYQIGMEPNRIDIMMGIPGVEFEPAYSRRQRATYGGVSMAVLSREDLIRAKRAAGRPQDLLDLEELQALD
jgi:hypothetical protein